MLAVAILGLIAMTIYRFVETTLFAVRVSSEHVRETGLMEAFTGYLRNQMQSLPAFRNGAISGEAHRFNNVPSDELRWIASPGSGLLTRNATGEWNVTLTIQRVKGSKEFELGFRRQDVEARSDASWLPLLPDVSGFEVRYFDTRAMAWMDKWTDIAVRPALVEVKLWRGGSPDAYDVILPLPVNTGMAPPGAPGTPGNPVIPGISGSIPTAPSAGVPRGYRPQLLRPPRRLTR